MAHRDGAYPGFSSMKQLEVFLLPPGWNASPSQGHLQRSHRWYPFIQLGGVSHCNGKVSCPRIQTMDGTKDPYEFLSFARAFIEKGSQRRISFISRLKRAINNKCCIELVCKLMPIQYGPQAQAHTHETDRNWKHHSHWMKLYARKPKFCKSKAIISIKFCCLTCWG